MRTPILDLFDFAHLPPPLQHVARPFHDLANEIEDRFANFERDYFAEPTVTKDRDRSYSIAVDQKNAALNAILLAKDAAVRMAVAGAKLK